LPGIFNISLDFELHWGRFDKVALDEKGKLYFDNTRAMFPEMVRLFLEHEIHVTWAIVGMLYHPDATAWRNHIPEELPQYTNKEFSSYEWVQKYGLTEPLDVYHFAPELIELIEPHSVFEMATHTYSHYYCKESGQTAASFRADMEMAKRVAANRGHMLRSLVFPRNQFNNEYLQICTDLGIEVVRSNPAVWYWDENRPESLLKKIFRTGDAYTGLLGNKIVKLRDIDVNAIPVQLPASRLYRAWTSKSGLLNKLKMKRILNEMTAAAREGAYYHLWWHPHNFGWNPKECLNELNIILTHYKVLEKKYGFMSLTMLETKKYLQNNGNT